MKKAEVIGLNEYVVINKISIIRGQKVMLDKDLAELYQVETRVLNQQVKRNIKRFPNDFMFQLSREEFENLISQNVTSSWGGMRKAPLAFTEQGLAMLSGVLKKEQAKPRTKIGYLRQTKYHVVIMVQFCEWSRNTYL